MWKPITAIAPVLSGRTQTQNVCAEISENRTNRDCAIVGGLKRWIPAKMCDHFAPFVTNLDNIVHRICDIVIISKYRKAPDRVGWVLSSFERGVDCAE